MRRFSAKNNARRNALVALGTYLVILGMGLVLYGLLWVDRDPPQGLKPRMTSSSTALDLSTLAPCPGEYGPATRDPDAACVWDAAVQGSHIEGATVRWLVYLPVCPVETVQNRALVVCVPFEHWGE